MTKAELIEALKKYPDDMEIKVYCEGDINIRRLNQYENENFLTIDLDWGNDYD